MNRKRMFQFVSWATFLLAFVGASFSARSVGATAEVMPEVERIDSIQASVQWDPFFEEQMKNFGVHGAVMVMVQDGQIVFAKGYGYADAEAGTPLDPETTILRAGSIAKTVTAVAVMQLAERGQIDLDADVNDYLEGYKVPGTFPQPVTARHLINMTAGFDTRWVGIRAGGPESIIPLEEYLQERMPPRVLPPGEVRRYNDHEVALAGYLVEQVSGMPFEEYARTNIFAPLDMDSSSFLLSPEASANAARGYPVDSGPEGAYPLSFYYLNTAPGSGFNTTATDIGRYMSAHLQPEVAGSASAGLVLSQESMQRMHDDTFRYHPLLPGQANTFDERFLDGKRYLRKQGGAPGMHNNMILLTDQGMGFYLFYNSDGTGLRNRWADAVLEAYLAPLSGEPASELTGYGPDLAEAPISFDGDFLEMSDTTSESTIVKLQALMAPDGWVRVAAQNERKLLVNGRELVEVEPGVFQDASSGGYTAFKAGPDGRAAFLYRHRTAYERVPWSETPAVQLALLGAAVLIFLSGLAAGVIALFRRRPGRGLAGLVSGISLLFLVGLGVSLLPLALYHDVWSFSQEPSWQLRAVLALPIIAGVFAIALLSQTVLAWRRSRFSRSIRIHNTLVLAGFVGFLYFLQVWNLLGWRF
ncbi:MAG: serine hydrolase [Anaerolineales bacterium]|nr:serine hydrolase [Anaerolineales bacterium]